MTRATRRRFRNTPACPTSPTSRATTRMPAGPITFLFNGGPGSSTVWLHMGAFGPKRVVTANDSHSPAAPYRRRRQRIQPARCQRPGVRRCARHRLRPPARRGQGEGVLRRRPGCARLRQLHRRVPVPPRSLELAEVPVRRELRHHARRGARLHPAEREVPGPERRHPAVADPQLRRQRRCAAIQSGRRSAVRAGAADLHGHRVVSPQAAESAPGARAAADGSGAVRAGRLLARPVGGQYADARSAKPRLPDRLHDYTGLPQDYIERANLRVNGGRVRKERCSAATRRRAAWTAGSPAPPSIR